MRKLWIWCWFHHITKEIKSSTVWFRHVKKNFVALPDFTFGRASKYESGTSISAKATLLIAIAAFSIWLVHSRVWFNCFLVSSLRPPAGTRGTGSHHFSSCLCIVLRKEADPSPSGATIPWSTYQNSVSTKLSKTSCHWRRQANDSKMIMFEKKTRNWGINKGKSYKKHIV